MEKNYFIQVNSTSPVSVLKLQSISFVSILEMEQHPSLLIIGISLMAVSCDELSTKTTVESTPELPPSPDPKLFYVLYDSRQDPNMILDVSRLWDTDTQLEHFQYLHNQIDDPKIDQDTKKYARSVLKKADQRFKEAFQELDLKIDYDLMDIIREVKNIQDDQPPICQQLRSLLLEADEKSIELAKKREKGSQGQKQTQPDTEENINDTKKITNDDDEAKNTPPSLLTRYTSIKIGEKFKKLFHILSNY